MRKINACFIILILIVSCNCNNTTVSTNTVIAGNDNSPAIMQYSILKVYPHDTASFTEGLYLSNNFLFESTGMNGESKLRKVDLTNGKATQEIKLDTSLFGEGISMIDGKIYQLTYREHKVFVYDAATFKKIKEMQWPFEGWGMTTDGKQLIISTGSSNLYYVNPDDFKILKTVNITDNNGPVGNINELEYVDGKIYANVYETFYIIKINPESGTVESKADLTGVLEKTGTHYNPQKIDVLNGIAYNAANKSFYITGKYWPALFEVKFN